MGISMNVMCKWLGLGMTLILGACGGGGGGGGESTTCTSTSQFAYCYGSGSTYFCQPVGGRSTYCSSSSPSTPIPEPSAQPFAVNVALQNIISTNGFYQNLRATPFTPTPDINGREQMASVAISKNPSPDTFFGVPVTRQTTNSTWSGVYNQSDFSGWYVTPYIYLYNSNNLLMGFALNGTYGVRTSGPIANPTNVNSGASGSLGGFDVFQDNQFINQIGTASFTYSVLNCCDLWDKNKADLTLVLTINLSAGGTLVHKQKYVITTTGSVRSLGYESFTSNNGTRMLYYSTSGY
jgi:hypothetical protein